MRLTIYRFRICSCLLCPMQLRDGKRDFNGNLMRRHVLLKGYSISIATWV